MFELARTDPDEGMIAQARLQQAELASEAHGCTATRISAPSGRNTSTTTRR